MKFNFKLIFSQPEEGFTLVELIIVIVLLGILGVMGADFISQAFKGFQNTDTRLEIAEEGKTALSRMEREIINSIPNAVGLNSGTDIRIGLIAENKMETVSGQYTENTPLNTITDSSGQALPDGTIISIYNLNWTQFSDNTISNRRLYKVSGNPMVINTTFKTSIIFEGSGPPESHRYYAADKAVRYYLDGNTLYRSQILIDQEDESFDFSTAQHYPLATDITNLTFGYSQGAKTRNAVITIEFTIQKNGESITFHKEVHARNAP